MIILANKIIPANRIIRANKIVLANRIVRIPERGEIVYIQVYYNTGEKLALDNGDLVMVPSRYANN